MSDFIDVEVQLYPELLRRLAAGERLASSSDEAEKIAATALVVEAIENEKKAQEPAPAAIEKQAIVGEVALGLTNLMPVSAGVGAGLLSAGPLKKLIQAARGKPAIPEETAEILKSFRSIVQERAATEAARRNAVLMGAAGVGAGALAMKALSKSKDESSKKESSAPAEVATKAADEVAAPAEVAKPEENSVATRGILDKILKQLQ